MKQKQIHFIFEIIDKETEDSGNFNALRIKVGESIKKI